MSECDGWGAVRQMADCARAPTRCKIVFRKLDGWPDVASAVTSAAPNAEAAA
jgi:hypothetical protein